MNRNIPHPDPIRAFARNARAKSRLGRDARCDCDENRALALMRKGNVVICAECDRKNKRQLPFDKHHVAGRANSPVAIWVPVNEHRARLSADQYDWPKRTLENPHGSPLLRAAACSRGLISIGTYLVEKLSVPTLPIRSRTVWLDLYWIAEFLERTDARLAEEHGAYWWLNTPFGQLLLSRLNAKK